MKRFSLRTASGRTRIIATGAVVAAMAGTVVVSAFGTTAGAASAATPGVTSTTITLGATEPLTGVAANYDDIAPAMAAVFAWANAHGGVNGRKIDFKYLDDQYTPSVTSTMTHELVLQDNIFADVGSLGTPTQLAVQGYLNSQKIPQLFILSGCNCWSSSQYPDSSGYQPPYTVDGKILGAYVAKNFTGEKIGYFTQDDEFGQDVIKGLNREIKSSCGRVPAGLHGHDGGLHRRPEHPGRGAAVGRCPGRRDGGHPAVRRAVPRPRPRRSGTRRSS